MYIINMEPNAICRGLKDRISVSNYKNSSIGMKFSVIAILYIKKCVLCYSTLFLTLFLKIGYV